MSIHWLKEHIEAEIAQFRMGVLQCTFETTKQSGKASIMHKQAMALGYFFLAVFCLFTSAQDRLWWCSTPLLLAAAGAALIGCGFLWSACAHLLPAVKTGLVKMVHLAQQPPVEQARRVGDGQSA